VGPALISGIRPDAGRALLSSGDVFDPGVSAADNEMGWRMALAKLAALAISQ
jgi:hypothetical protein